MTKSEKAQKIQHLQNEVNSPKSSLIDLMHRLEEVGAIREANSLGTIIGKLEAWQHK